METVAELQHTDAEIGRVDKNGQRYYLDVMQNYEKALKLDPDNQLARQLLQKFIEGMKQQTGN